MPQHGAAYEREQRQDGRLFGDGASALVRGVIAGRVDAADVRKAAVLAVEQIHAAVFQHAAAEHNLAAAAKLHARHVRGKRGVRGDGGGILRGGVGAVQPLAALKRHGSIRVHGKADGLAAHLPGVDVGTDLMHVKQDRVPKGEPHPCRHREIDGGKDQRHERRGQQHGLLIPAKASDSLQNSTSVPKMSCF